LSGVSNGFIYLWDIESGNLLKQFKAHNGFVTSLRVAFDGSYFVSASGDKTIKHWNLKTFECEHTLPGH